MNRIQPWIARAKIDSPARIAYAGVAVSVVALLFNSPGLAIILASLIVPAIALLEIPRRDVYENEPRWSSPAMLGYGAIVGIVFGAAAAATAASLWIEGAALHVGAAGFGGQAADIAGTPGFGVLLINGIALAAGSVAVASFGPYALRRYPVFRNEVMDGVTLGIAAGFGLATGTTIVQVWPMLSGSGANGASVSDWTAMLFGLLVTRPIILGLVTSFVCAGLWHVALTQRTPDLVLPVGAGLGGAIVFAFGDLLVQPSGARIELVWHLVVVIGLGVAARFIFRRAIAQDRRSVTGATGIRTVCRSCGSITPASAYCAVCGAPLTPELPKPPAVEAEPIEIGIEPDRAEDEQSSPVIDLPQDPQR